METTLVKRNCSLVVFIMNFLQNITPLFYIPSSASPQPAAAAGPVIGLAARIIRPDKSSVCVNCVHRRHNHLVADIDSSRYRPPHSSWPSCWPGVNPRYTLRPPCLYAGPAVHRHFPTNINNISIVLQAIRSGAYHGYGRRAEALIEQPEITRYGKL